MEHIPRVIRPLQDVRCCDGDSVTLEALIDAPETSLIRWEKQGKVLKEGGDIHSEWDGSVAKLKIKELYPEDEGEYSCIVFNDLGKAVTSATIVVEMADDKENDVTVQMEYRPDLSRRTTPSRTNTPSRYSRSPSVNFQRHRRTTPEPSARSKQRRVQRPKFYYIPHDRIVEEGETVTFQCAVKGVPLPRATWDKDSRKILPGGRIKMEEKDEIRLLEIPKVTQQDAGLYRVTIDNGLGREQATARLDVIKASPNKYLGYVRTWHSAPTSAPKFTRTIPKATLREGSKLTLETYYSGSPSPRVKWYRNHALLPFCKEFPQTADGKRATLQIDNVAMEDAGNYTCFLVSKAGRAECSAQVVVERNLKKSEQAPYFLTPLTDISALDGDEVRLTVKIEGSRPLKVLWVHKYKEITPCKDFRYEEGPEGEYSLVITDAFPKDSGVYFCEAYNAYGHTICHAKLEVTDPYALTPSSPKICGPLLPMTVSEGEAARFSVRLMGHPAPKVTWFLDDQEIRTSETVQLKIDEPEEGEGLIYSLGLLAATPQHSGVLSVVASNEEGTSSIQTTLKVDERKEEKAVMANLSCEEKVEETLTSPDKEVDAKEMSPSRSPSSKSPVSKLKSLREMMATGSLDSAYCSGRSSSLSVASETDTQDPLSKLETMTTQEEQSETCETVSSATVEEDEGPNESEEEFRGFNDEDTGSVIIRGPDDTIVLKGQCAVLSASFKGHPEPEVTWYKKDKEIQDGGRYTITKEGNTTSLAIKNVTFDDCDKYTLKVRNHLSAHSSFASLAVEGYPEPPGGKPNLSDVTNSSVVVSWYGSTYDGGKAVIGYRIEGRKIGNVDWDTFANRCHSTSFKVENLEKGAQYEFRVRAENIHGISEPSKISNLVSLQDEYDGSTGEISEDETEILSSSAYKLGSVSLENGDLFSERFDQHEEVGKGRFGVVYRVTERQTGRKRAAKLIKCIRKDEREKVKEEIAIMNSLRHPKLLQLLAAYERKKDCVMIMEYISSGELFERVVADDFTLTERDCILFLRQICEGVAYMHSNSIVHLDLKPENILCVHRRSHQIKLIDFGLARKLDVKVPCRVLFGTPEFVAPEIINFEPISFASDMWSVGVICYVLLSGLSPFMGESDSETFSNITRAEYDFDDDAFDAISEDAKEFITRLLDKRKEKRPAAIDCLKCGWLAQSEKAMNKAIIPTDKLKRFIIRRKWQKTGNAIRALGRMANLSHLRNSSPTRLSSLPENRIPYSPSSTPPPYSSSKSEQLENSSSSSEIPQRLKYYSKPLKASGIIVNERSDSGISELSTCSSALEDSLSKRSTSSLQSFLSTSDQSSLVLNNSSPIPGGGSSFHKTGATTRLNWQSSVDSAVSLGEDDVSERRRQYSSSSMKICNDDALLPSKRDPCLRQGTHSRV